MINSNRDKESISEILESDMPAENTEHKAGKKFEPHILAMLVSVAVLTGLLGLLIGFYVSSTKEHQEPETQQPSSWLIDETEGLNYSDSETGENQEAVADDISILEDNAESADDSIKEGIVQSGIPVIKSLASLGLSQGDAQLIINSLDGIFDFRSARPGHTFSVKFDEDNSPVLFRYEASPTQIYVVTKKDDKFSGRQLEIITDLKTRVFAGTITSSLFGTMNDLGARPSLAARVAEILSTQVNFLREQRPGDTFRVVVEEEFLKGDFLGYGSVLGLEYNGVKAGKRRLFRFAPGDENTTYYDDDMISVPSSSLTIPLYYSRMSSPFGWRIHPVLKQRRLHNGVDFSAPTGTPVWACAEGTVTFAGYKGANGNLVSIEHEGGLISHYAHLQRIAPGIKLGAKVRRKQVIGYVGSTGRSTGPHLHWGLKYKGEFVDPLKFRVVPGKKIAPRYRNELQQIINKIGRLMNNTPIEPPKGELDVVPDGDEPLGDY